MSYLDTYYRAFIDYRKNTVQDKDCGSQRTATKKANAKKDNVIVTRKICHVNTDWIETIEKGLEHVDKAIREERQFIRSNGEVVDIEKVKSVSKDSVKHLAQHSNLITRYTEGEDIIPDRLYIVERLNDYAVYENRFLYMMLCYLRDFITVRYNKILELEHTYNATMAMNKKIEMPRRRISLDISLAETRSDDPFLKERSESKDVIARIRDILEYVHAFLNTPLMQEVSKVPMIKPPITKTNVLRMNNNFRGALALYEYAVAYQGDGYTVEEKVQKIQPFRIDMADEFSEIVLLSSFLTYQHGMGIKAALQEAFEAEEERRRLEMEQKHLEQLRALRRRIEESGESPEEYMLMLERRNRVLEADSEQLKVALKQIADLEARNEYLTNENNELTQRIDDLRVKMENMEIAHKKEIETLNDYYERKMAALCAHYEQIMTDMREAHAAEISALQDRFAEEREQMLAAMQTAAEEHRLEMQNTLEAHAAQLEEMTQVHTLAMQQLAQNCENTVAEITHRAQTEISDMTALHTSEREALKAAWLEESTRLQNACNEKDLAIQTKTRENEQLESAKRLTEARLLALRKEHGMIPAEENHTSKASFEELEHQFEVFKALFNEEWKKTKKHIRKKTFQSYKDAVKEGRDKEFREQLADFRIEDEVPATEGVDSATVAENQQELTQENAAMNEIDTQNISADTVALEGKDLDEAQTDAADLDEVVQEFEASAESEEAAEEPMQLADTDEAVAESESVPEAADEDRVIALDEQISAEENAPELEKETLDDTATGQYGDEYAENSDKPAFTETVMPQQPWNAPQQPWNVPQQPWNVPQQPWNAPQQPWNVPQQPWNAPQQPWNAPQQPWNAPQQPWNESQQEVQQVPQSEESKNEDI